MAGSGHQRQAANQAGFAVNSPIGCKAFITISHNLASSYIKGVYGPGINARL